MKITVICHNHSYIIRQSRIRNNNMKMEKQKKTMRLSFFIHTLLLLIYRMGMCRQIRLAKTLPYQTA